MKKLSCALATAFLTALPTLVFAAGAVEGGTKQSFNSVAIGMRRILRKIAESEFGGLGDTSTLADPSVVDDLIEKRKANS